MKRLDKPVLQEPVLYQVATGERKVSVYSRNSHGLGYSRVLQFFFSKIHYCLVYMYYSHTCNVNVGTVFFSSA